MRKAAPWALGLAAASAAGLALSGLGARAGLWDFRAGFSVLRWSAYGGIAAAALAVFAGFREREAKNASLALSALILGLLVAGIPWMWLRAAKSAPPIHDVSTDTEDPPRFEAVLTLRRGAPNPPDPASPEVVARQKAAYPFLRPLDLEIPPGEAFERALGAVRRMGWEIAASDSKKGMIEATDTTLWFGFKDDVVVRVRPGPRGSRVDARSVSRVGKGDAGANARRIKRLLRRVELGG